MDNLSFHVNTNADTLYKANKIIKITTIAYESSLNPIETLFNVAKKHYRKLLLTTL